MSHSFRIADAQLSLLTNVIERCCLYEKRSKNYRFFTRANWCKFFLRDDFEKNIFNLRNRFSRLNRLFKIILDNGTSERKKEKYERCQKWKRSCLERSNRVEKCELIRAPPTNVTHARTREYSRCFTCSHSAELQLVLRALVYTHAHRRTQKRHSGACRPHKCACVRDEFIPLCLVHVHAYVNTRFPLTRAQTRTPNTLRRVKVVSRVWVHHWSRFVLTK